MGGERASTHIHTHTRALVVFEKWMYNRKFALILCELLELANGTWIGTYTYVENLLSGVWVRNLLSSCLRFRLRDGEQKKNYYFLLDHIHLAVKSFAYMQTVT